MKEFNWETCTFKGPRLLWLRENFNKKVSLDKFMEMIESTRSSTSNNHRSPSYGRQQYKTLKDKFGFFQ